MTTLCCVHNTGQHKICVLILKQRQEKKRKIIKGETLILTDTPVPQQLISKFNQFLKKTNKAVVKRKSDVPVSNDGLKAKAKIITLH